MRDEARRYAHPQTVNGVKSVLCERAAVTGQGAPDTVELVRQLAPSAPVTGIEVKSLLVVRTRYVNSALGLSDKAKFKHCVCSPRIPGRYLSEEVSSRPRVTALK